MDISKKIIFLLLLLILLLFSTSVSALSDEAYLFAHTNKTLPVVSSGVWVNITFDEEITEFKKDITHSYNGITNDTFTIDEKGIYEINYHLSFEDSAASPNAHIVTRIIQNNVEIHGSLLEEDSSKQNADLIIHNSLLANCSIGDKIKFQFTSDDTTVSLTSDATYGDHKDTAVITIKKIADTYDNDFWFYVILMLAPLVLIILSKMTEDNWFKLLAGFGLVPFALFIIQESTLPNLSGTYIRELFFFIIVGLALYLIVKSGIDLIKESS